MVVSLAAAAAGAQDAPPQTPATIVLPRKLVAESRATLAVLDANGRLVPGATVELSGFGEVKTDATGRATFVAPDHAVSLSAQFKMGGAISQAPIVPEPVSGARNSHATTRIDSVPRAIAIGEPFDLGGSGFNGDAAQDRITIGDESSLVLAASPVSLVALPNSGVALGDARLSVAVQGQPIADSWPVTVVALDLAGPASPLAAGATGRFMVRVAGSTKPMLVQVSDFTPDVVDLPGGNVRRLATGGGISNLATLEVVGVRAGDYSVSVRLIPVLQGVPDTETARLELLDARAIADGKWQQRLDGVLALLQRQPPDLTCARKQIAQQLRNHPAARIQDSLQVVWQLLAVN